MEHYIENLKEVVDTAITDATNSDSIRIIEQAEEDLEKFNKILHHKDVSPYTIHDVVMLRSFVGNLPFYLVNYIKYVY